MIPTYITLRGELNEAEQRNILEAQEWAFARRRDALDERFLNRLHQRMLGNVWRWAGTYRHTGKSVGVEAYRIPEEVRQLIGDVRYWITHGTYAPDEIAARFHHRLVWIHCYPNGNGRHARFAADLLLVQLDRPRFSWGSATALREGAARSGRPRLRAASCFCALVRLNDRAGRLRGMRVSVQSRGRSHLCLFAIHLSDSLLDQDTVSATAFSACASCARVRLRNAAIRRAQEGAEPASELEAQARPCGIVADALERVIREQLHF